MTRILEVEENGTLTLPSDALENAPPRSRYVLETDGRNLLLRPETEKPAATRKRRKQSKLSWEEWERERDALSVELSKVWPEGVSATDVISEMRR
jgi:hypothetical protein